ncbi:ABC transporter ATP-binding protein [Kitasatospora sp. NPDC058243]|uniref:ABC transporter ATP-binding protein n=1 Tax=Kitasatospora sp. NPDC058243 TaxID=3346397 RepID=UPI0036DD0528
MTTSTRSVPRLLAAAALEARGWFALAVLASITDAAVTLATPALLARALDDALAHRPLTGPVSALAAAFAVATGVAVVHVVAGGTSGAAATGWLRRGLVHRVLGAGLAGQRRYGAGDVTGRLVGSCAESGHAGLTVLDTVMSVATSIVGVVSLWLIDWRPAVTFLLGLPPVYVVLRLFFRRSSSALMRYQELQGQIADRLIEALGGVRTIRASGTVAAETTRVLEPLPELSRTGLLTWHLQRATAWQMGLLLPVIEILVLAVSGYGVVAGRISPGELVAVTGYVAIALGLLQQIDAVGELAHSVAAGRRVAEAVGQPVTPAGERGPDGSTAGCAVSFRGVRLLAGDRVVLDGIDLEIPAGTALAVVGASGGGKSSLAALVGRLHDPDQGTVLLDGVPVTEFTADELSRRVAYAFERPALFDDTIRATIALARPEATQSVIEAAARAAGADDFIRRLPDGYDTRLAGAPLSGGEVQRLGLARAFAQDSRVVVLDDATSSLDTVTEARVTQALHSAFTGRTRIMVAHRASTAARADLVAWLADGRIRAVATHAELWNDQEYQAQFAAASESVEEETCPIP